jgi:hypothetical protein
MKIVVPVSVLVIALVFLSGCTSNPAVRNRSEGALHTQYEYTDGWSPGQGCYERVTGFVYNTGNVPVDAVRLTFNLVNTRTGTIRDSRSVFIGPVGPGNTTSFETVLDGECTQDYRVDFMDEK